MQPAHMNISEFASRLGYTNPEALKKAMRRDAMRHTRDFPLGFAYNTGEQWVYVIPREPAEAFIKTGRLPDLGTNEKEA